VLDAKDEFAANFYNRFGFQRFASRPLSFFCKSPQPGKLIEK
jgi:hypothetical protein